ncbi:MAG TPA: hypothetical protein VFT22_15850 [Kofleriaceae bacterium]|nr:hypothetical protein [Kofleriaceae bacterium]
MHKPPFSLVSLALLSTLAATGCHDDPPTPTEVRGAITSDLGNVLRESDAAITGSTDAIPGSSALTLVDHLLGTSTQTSLPLRALTSRLAARVPSFAAADATKTIDADAEVSALNDKLFTDANHVGDGVYQVPASLVCTSTTVDSTGQTVETIDQDCADQLAKIDLRVRTAKEDGALVFALQIDADHDEPLILSLTHTSIAITVDLDGTQRAFVALASLYGEDLPNASLSGQVTGKLEVLGAAKARASLTIDRALAIAFAKAGVDLAGPDAFVFTSARAEVFAVTLDGAARSGSFALGLGESAFKLPADASGKRTELDLGGATATATFANGQPLELTHLGLGDRTTTLLINGERGLAIDLNPQDGRTFDLDVSRDAATGLDTITVKPRLDLQLAIDHVVLGDEPPVYDVTRVLLDGSLRSSDTSDEVEVASGSFGISTDPAGHGFTAAAGQCVTSSEAIDPTSGQSFTQWAVGACTP